MHFSFQFLTGMCLKCVAVCIFLALEERIELPTGALQVHCSRQLSYSSITKVNFVYLLVPLPGFEPGLSHRKCDDLNR